MSFLDWILRRGAHTRTGNLPANVRHGSENVRETAERSRNVLSPDDIATIRLLRADGISLREIAAELGVSISTVARHARGVEAPQERDVLVDVEEFAGVCKRVDQTKRALAKLTGGGQQDMVSRLIESSLPQYLPDLRPLVRFGVARFLGSQGVDVASLLANIGATGDGASTASQGPAAAANPGSPPMAPGMTTLFDKLPELLTNMQPSTAVTLLVEQAQASAMAAGLARSLASLSEAELPSYLDQVAGVNAELGPTVAWLKAHTDWTAATLAELRRLMGTPAGSAP